MLGWTSHARQILLSEFTRPRFEAARKDPEIFLDSMELRNALLDFVADFSKWENGTNREFLATSRALTTAANEVLNGAGSSAPILVDPFSGGGAIPLEGLRIGADAIASDTNPLALLIEKVALEYAPTYGEQLAAEVEEWSKAVNRRAASVLSGYYPNADGGTTPIAYLWARTVLSEAPDEHEDPVEIPLIRSMWLSKKGTLVALRWKRDEKQRVMTESRVVSYANGNTIRVRRPILEVFFPTSNNEVGKGTVARNAATCPVTGFTTPAKSVQRQLTERMGGASDARMYCVVSTRPGQSGRLYTLPDIRQEECYEAARIEASRRFKEVKNGYPLFPIETLPVMSGVFNAPLYGHASWASLFNARQLLALTTYVDLARERILQIYETDRDYGAAVAAVFGLLIDRLADLNASLCVWQLSTPNTAHVFGRWALPMIMDYGEVNPLAGAGGSPESAAWRIAASLRDIANMNGKPAQVMRCSADDHVMPSDSVDAFITDPPYYNAVPYADISDFFYVWLRRTIGDIHSDLFQTDLVPKESEICEMAGWDPVRYKHKDKEFFERKMREAAERARDYLKPNGIGVVVFAHKSTSGWEAMLQALVDAGWIITASWPIDTEMASRLRAKNSAALASSIHLVCRPREYQDGILRTHDIGDWRDVLSELPRRIHEWMPRLAEEGVVGADAIFACLGPALEVFSRYSRVEKASGEVVTLREYLEQVWAAVAKEALAQVFKDADTAGFEPDARLTAMWLWTLNAGAINGDESPADEEEADDEEETKGKSAKAKGGFVLEYDAARKIAQGLGAHLEDLDHVVEVSGESARLLPVSERTQYLFGKEQADAPTGGRKKKAAQMDLFGELTKAGTDDTAWSEKTVKKIGETTLDRVHQAMILFAAGRGEALKRFLVEDGAGRDQRFWRLAQALSALYPSATSEKRWVDGVLARKKGLGL